MDDPQTTVDIEQAYIFGDGTGEQSMEEPDTGMSEKPRINVTYQADELSAEIELIKGTDQTIAPSKEDIETALRDKGIICGINADYISALVKRPIYGHKIEIARGMPAKTGADGFLICVIDIKNEARERTDSTIDNGASLFIRNVAKEQVLCEVHRAEKGEDGFTVFGHTLNGAYGREPDFVLGKNTAYDEERSVIYATADGNAVVMEDGSINVEDTLNIQGNVDSSTGNINFIGNILINGDVLSGFKVEAKGNITVMGDVGGAKIISKGDITIKGDADGKNRALIRAGKSIKGKHIQNCSLTSGDSIFADSITNCVIECNGSVELSGESGALAGGDIVIANALIAQEIGSASKTDTSITMTGTGLKNNRKINQIKKEIIALDAELIAMIQTITWCEGIIKKGQTLKPFQENALKLARVRNVKAKNEREEKNLALEAAQNEALHIDSEKTYIQCGGCINTGVKITIGLQAMSIGTPVANCKIQLIDGQIAVSPLNG